MALRVTRVSRAGRCGPRCGRRPRRPGGEGDARKVPANGGAKDPPWRVKKTSGHIWAEGLRGSRVVCF